MVRRARLLAIVAAAILVLGAACPIPRAVAQAVPPSTTVRVSYVVYEGMEQAYVRWIQRAVSPSFPDPDPVAISLYERAGGPLNGAGQVELGMTDLALVSQLAASESWIGRNAATGPSATPHRRLRALFPAYRSALLFLKLPRESPGPSVPIGSGLSPLSNDRVAFWPVPEDLSAQTALAGAVLRTLSVPFQPDRFGSGLTGMLDDMFTMLGAKAVGFLDGLPNWQLEYWLGTGGLPLWVLVPSATEKSRLQRDFPFLEFLDIRPGGLGQRWTRPPEGAATRAPLNAETIRTLGMWNFVVVRSDMPVCVAYRIVDAVMTAARRAGHPAQEVLTTGDRQETSYVNLEGTRPENFARIQDIPLHAGAALWLRNNSHPVPRDPRREVTAEICD